LKVLDAKTNSLSFVGWYYKSGPGATPPSEESQPKLTDADNDGLSDADEVKYKTNPKNSNTDGDGYNDGTEVLWGFDPTKIGEVFIREIYVFNRPRLADLQVEQDLGNTLKTEVKKLLPSTVYNKINNWQDLINAYVYGGYTAKAIAQNVRYPGKTVDPLKLIRGPLWQETKLYRDYINK
jgi:hypothetical protein